MDATIIRDKLIGNDDERAVSPVIGVILMVAITVILAAVIAAFVMDLGDMSESANAGIDFNEDDEDVTVQVIDEGNTDSIYVEIDADDGVGFIEPGDDGSSTDDSVGIGEDDLPEDWDVGDSADLDLEEDIEEINVYGEVGGDAQVVATWEE